MEKLIYRKNKLFIIDKSKLKPAAKKDEVCNALYAAIYEEFSGAVYNDDYKDMSSVDRLWKMNDFAWKWLEKRGLK